eukprot:evm.model.scf_16.19 EVM.evm.TU.scf_16.19   scf_16:204198-210310(+)
MSRRAASPRLAGAAARLLALAVAWIAAGPGALGGRVEPGAPIVTSCAGLQGALEGLAGGNSDLTILVEGSLDCGPGAWNRKISVGGSLRLEARGPGAVIDWGALRGGLVLEDGAVLGLANLVLAQEAMGDEVAVAAVGAAGNKGRAIMEMAGCSILSRSCGAPPGEYVQKLEAGARAAGASPSPGGASELLVQSGSGVQTFRPGFELEIRMYGMLLWEMVSGSKAFSGMHRNEVMVATVEGRRPAIPSHCPTKFASLIQECWQQDNARRPTFKKILSQLRRLASTYSSSAAHSLMGTAIKEERQSVELRHSLEIAASKKLSIEAGKARVVKAHAMPAQCLDSSGVSSGDRPPLPAPPLPAPPATVRSPPKSNPLWTGLPRKTEVIGNPLWGARRSLGSRPSQDPGRFPLWAFGSPAPVTDLPDVGSPKGPREEEGSRVMAMKRLPLRVPQRVSADCHEPALTSRSDSASEFASPHFRRDADKPPARGGDEPASGTLDPSSRSSSVTVPMVSACGPGTAMPWRSVTPNYTQHNVGLGNFRPRTSLDNVGMLQPRASVEGRPSADLLPVLGAGKTPMVNPQVSLWLTTSQGSNLGLGSVAACQSPAAALAPAAAQPQLPASPVATPPSPTAPSSPVPPSTPTPTRKRGGRACAAVGAGTVIPRLAISKIMGSPSEQLIKSPECRPQEWDLQCADGADVKVDKHHPKPSWWNSIDTTGSWSFRSAHSEGASRSTSDERKRSGESMLITPGSTPVQPAAEDTSFPRVSAAVPKARVSAAGSSVKSRVSVGAGRERRYSSRLFTTDPGLGAAMRAEHNFNPMMTQSDCGDADLQAPLENKDLSGVGDLRVASVRSSGRGGAGRSVGCGSVSGVVGGMESGGKSGVSMWQTSEGTMGLTASQMSMPSEMGSRTEVMRQWDAL